MKTRLEKRGLAYIVSFEGKIHYEDQDAIRDHLEKILKGIQKGGLPRTAGELSFFSSTDSPPRRVVFNFHQLEFVGSSGITQFLQLLSEFSSRAPLPTSLCHVSSEFRQMIRAVTQTALWDFFETEDQALYSGPRPRIDQ